MQQNILHTRWIQLNIGAGMMLNSIVLNACIPSMDVKTHKLKNTIMNKNKLKLNYENACHAYVQAFCDKHGYEYDRDMWVAGDVGGIICISDLYVGIDDIRTDIDKNAPEDEFIEWYDYSLRLGMLNAKYPNYENWLRKCPIKSEAEIIEMETLREKIQGLKLELKEMCGQQK